MVYNVSPLITGGEVTENRQDQFHKYRTSPRNVRAVPLPNSIIFSALIYQIRYIPPAVPAVLHAVAVRALSYAFSPKDDRGRVYMAVKTARKKAKVTSEEALRIGLGDFVAMSPDLDGVDVRVYVYLSGRCNFHEPVHVPQIEMAAMLGRQQTHISRALRNLVAAGVLLPGPNGSRASEWMLNPDYGT